MSQIQSHHSTKTQKNQLRLLHKVQITEPDPTLVLVVHTKNYKYVSCIRNITYIVIIKITYKKI